MKRITATVLLLTAISAPALAESPVQRDMHSWGYVQQKANTALAPAEAPMMERREPRMYHHDAGKKAGKHHKGKHHKGKKHHHHADKAKKGEMKENKPAQEQPKQ